MGWGVTLELVPIKRSLLNVERVKYVGLVFFTLLLLSILCKCVESDAFWTKIIRNICKSRKKSVSLQIERTSKIADSCRATNER